MDERTLGGHVKALREGRLLTIAEAARRANLSRTKWADVEAGRNGVRAMTLRRIAEALDAPVGPMLDLAGYPHDDEPVPASPRSDPTTALEARLDRVEAALMEMVSLLHDLDRRIQGRLPGGDEEA